MKQKLYVLFITLVMLGAAPPAHAQSTPELTITPVVIDERGKARDILKETILVRNTTSHALELYPSVNNINSATGEQDFSVARDSSDLSDSLANWIELSRGMINLGPGEQKSIPFIIRVNLNAVAGTYHAQIFLTEGITRAEADARPPLGTVSVNFEVQADVQEILQLNKFTTDNIFFSGDDVIFNYQLQNIGNQDLEPKGHVHIYDRTGKEVATVDVNKDGQTLTPNQEAQLASVWSGANGFGRFKAMLDVDYGSSQTASVQDTVFFWVIPWKQMLGMFLGALITVIVLALYFHRWLERRHLYKFAHAGLLNDHTLQKLNEEEIEVPPPAAPEPVAPPRVGPVRPSPVHHEPALETRKKRFAFLHRRAVKRSESHAHEAARHEPAAPAEAYRGLKHVLKKKEPHGAHGHSIDLKELQARRATPEPAQHRSVIIPKAAPATVHGHVISLKKLS